ncbi:MAG: hypothetical protein ACKV19_29595 [Verrucomicrobiales bacterium]
MKKSAQRKGKPALKPAADGMDDALEALLELRAYEEATKAHRARVKQTDVEGIWTFTDDDGWAWYGGPPADPDGTVGGGVIKFRGSEVQLWYDRWGLEQRWLKLSRKDYLWETVTTAGRGIKCPYAWRNFVMIERASQDSDALLEWGVAVQDLIEEMSERAAKCVRERDADGLMHLAKAMADARDFAIYEQGMDLRVIEAIRKVALKLGRVPTKSEVLQKFPKAEYNTAKAAFPRLRFDWLPKKPSERKLK